MQRLLDDSGLSEAQFATSANVQQGTFNRWRNGVVIPDNAAKIASFAQAVGRNPIEAFVAAGVLSIENAAGAIDDDARELLAQLGAA